MAKYKQIEGGKSKGMELELTGKCDLCGREDNKIIIDGATALGPWGYMCGDCHRSCGVGLGPGRGQKYLKV